MYLFYLYNILYVFELDHLHFLLIVICIIDKNKVNLKTIYISLNEAITIHLKWLDCFDNINQYRHKQMLLIQIVLVLGN